MVGMKHYNKMYRPLPTNLTIKKSKIEGLGLFTNNVIKKGVELGITHIEDKRFEGGYIRTPLGGFINHSDTPNCEWFKDKDIIKIKTTKNITEGVELTLKYEWYNVNN